MMKKLTAYEVLWVHDEPIYIEHKTKGSWWDHAEYVHAFMDMNDLYLKETDTWLDCNEYGETWVAYRKGAES